jgi:hypothetical protein
VSDRKMVCPIRLCVITEEEYRNLKRVQRENRAGFYSVVICPVCGQESPGIMWLQGVYEESSP